VLVAISGDSQKLRLLSTLQPHHHQNKIKETPKRSLFKAQVIPSFHEFVQFNVATCQFLVAQVSTTLKKDDDSINEQGYLSQHQDLVKSCQANIKNGRSRKWSRGCY